LKVSTADQTLTINAATSIQLKDDGSIASASWKNEPRNPGQINNFVDRRHIKEPSASAVYPMTYALTVTDHGIFLAIWDQAFDERQDEMNFISPALRWILIQRPVDNKSGEPIVTGKAPVYCVFTTIGSGTVPVNEKVSHRHAGVDHSLSPNLIKIGETPSDEMFVEDGNGAKVYPGAMVRPYLLGNPMTWKGDPNTAYHWRQYFRLANAVQVHQRFTVCESDIHRPSLTVSADQDSEDANAILNANRQVATSEDNKYVVTIPKGLNTTRYAYTHELDMIGYTSADVIGEGTIIDLPLYEGDYRFQALAANRQRNTGMRILFRMNNEGDPVPAPDNGPMDKVVSGG
jgi:hypothetical protein